MRGPGGEYLVEELLMPPTRVLDHNSAPSSLPAITLFWIMHCQAESERMRFNLSGSPFGSKPSRNIRVNKERFMYAARNFVLFMIIDV